MYFQPFSAGYLVAYGYFSGLGFGSGGGFAACRKKFDCVASVSIDPIPFVGAVEMDGGCVSSIGGRKGSPISRITSSASVAACRSAGCC